MKRFPQNIIILVVLLLGFQSASAEWRKQKTDTLAWLRTVYFSDANTGWIGGSKGTLLKTEDAGATWKKQTGFSGDTIRQVIFSDPENGWLLCERDIFSRGRNEASYLMKTADGGETWDKVDFNNSGRQRITSIFFTENGFGMAVGETGALFGLKDDDQTWKKLALPSNYLMSDGVFADQFRGAIVGAGGTILFTEDAGMTWNRALVSGGSRSRFNAVFFHGKRTGWAVGSGGKIFQTLNSGKVWRRQRSNTNEKLNDIFFLNSAEGWAIGDNGEMLHTKTAGNIWRKTASKSAGRLESIFFNGDSGWIVGFGGTILKYDNASGSTSRKPSFRNRR